MEIASKHLLSMGGQVHSVTYILHSPNYFKIVVSQQLRFECI